MARKPEMPRINTVTVAFNGKQEAFENFMNSIINDYLNSTGEADFIENVELSVESASRLDLWKELWYVVS